MRKISFVLLIVIGAMGLTGCQGYNRMVEKQEAVTSQWGNVQNAYQRRADLIPNLVNTVKGYAQHEQETFTQVTEARAKATQTTINPENLTAESLQEYQQAQDQLSQALGRLLLIQENYPELKANQNFLALQDELAGTENRISVERNRFNQLAQDYNAYIRKFPQVIYAKWFKFEPKAYFEATPAAQTAPEVQF
ncbi:LemA protein [Porphyromonadaceae bacterium NLAE-zl-C104]|uniref:LemA family protein n=1 Tax=Proteiniphilum TaxID=294702 RepID=UPI00089AA42F|nr:MULTISPECIES: LemA family protein [Proteiniphilum]MDY9917349.1 LemA family protein [Proteiniphilum sp.]SDZ81789.1 LemA protein [Porphyromonadaceae bacterium KH3R12]SFS30431.1 LemA protein [Porphyromonadaceae bacterium NLAE-zl-C104]